jgi:hypothetical protein
MAIKSKKIDDSYSLIEGDIDSPNPHMKSILADLFEGEAKNIVGQMERVRWMTEEQATQFAMYFKPAGKTDVNQYNERLSHFVFIKPSDGKGRRKDRVALFASHERGSHMYETFLKLSKDKGFKPKQATVVEFALINWDKEKLGKKVSDRTLGGDFRNFLKYEGIKLSKLI